MKEIDAINRRDVLRTTGSAAIAGLGALGTSGTAVATEEEEHEALEAENYIETEDYVYRRVVTANTDMLLKFHLNPGKVEFAEIRSQSDSQALSSSTDTDPLKKQTRSITSGSGTASQQSDVGELNPADPSTIVDATQGYQTQSEGVIFEEVDVEVETIESCDSFTNYDDHMYYHVAMRLQDYSFDDLGDTIAFAVVCDALFILVGSKSKAFKKILEKIADTPLLRVVPDTVCGFIFGQVLDGIFSNGDGTFALWDKDGSLLNEPKIAAGGSTEYDPDPQDMRDDHKAEELPGAHTGALT